MILILGGTSDTAPLATRLAEANLRVLVSTATDEPLDVGCHENVSRRTGPLDEDGLRELIRRAGVRIVVDATHPYAREIRSLAYTVARRLDVPYFTYVRPATVIPESGGVTFVAQHDEAACVAFSFGKTVLLTTGSRNLVRYVAQSQRTGLALFARVLSRDESLLACREAGIPDEHIIGGRGPFDVEENRTHIRESGAGVIVTKDGGDAAGVNDKLEAARLEQCHVVVVARPDVGGDNVFHSITELARCVIQTSKSK